MRPCCHVSEKHVIVVGGGISGASFAFHAARAGRQVRVLEKQPRAGGCLASEASEDGFWYELGAHTCYNSYGAFLEVLEGCDLLGNLQARGKPVLRFLRGNEVVRGKNMLLLLKLFGKFELLRSVPRWFGAKQEGQTVRTYYSRLVGPENYERVLGAMLSAVPSQAAHDFPADMLFKKRERRQDVLRSYTLPGGLRTAIEAISKQARVEVSTDRLVSGIERAEGGFELTLADGERLRAPAVCLAVSPGAAAKLLRGVAPEAAEMAGQIQEAQVDSLGFVVPRAKVEHVPYATFLIPLKDEFHSIVTRDVVPDERWRSFTFHFRPGHSRDERIRRAAEVLKLRVSDIDQPTERRAVVPKPRLGHDELVTAIDRALEGLPLALSGNWFGGLSIEDCALRSRAEWQRISTLA